MFWLCGAAGVLFLVLLVWRVPQWGIPSTVTGPKERAELLNDNRGSVVGVIQMIGGLGFIATAYLAWRNLQVVERNYQIAEDKQVTDRFSKAVEMLADEKLEARLGGIYLLERIARDSREDHPVVMEVLAAFIRQKTANYDRGKVELDIQSALTVIARRNVENDQQPIDLRETILRKADLRNASFAGALLTKADLRESNLEGANLQRASLSWANLQEANLEQAILQEAHLTGTNLQKTSLLNADFQKAVLIKANLQGVEMPCVNLQGAKLQMINLQDAKLWKVNLQGANLLKADLALIEADEETIWPDKSEVAHAENIPDFLIERLGIKPKYLPRQIE